MDEVLMSRKTIFLDSFAIVRIVANPSFMELVKQFIANENYTLIIGVMNLIEFYRWKKRWEEISEFISSVPFCIAPNPEQLTDAEVHNYPEEITLPIAFCSSDHSYTRIELQEAIEANLSGKISVFDQRYRKEQGNILQSILDNRRTFPPEENGKYSTFQRWLFLNTNVMRFLLPTYKEFLEQRLSKQEEIKIGCFKSIYIQVLALFLEYYVQRKDGKPSDIGDLFQLSHIPYVDYAVVDNERSDLLQRMNRGGFFRTELPVYNLAQFRNTIGGGG
jgi:hypothetical protein